MRSLNKILLIPILILLLAIMGAIFLFQEFNKVLKENSDELRAITLFNEELSNANLELNRAILTNMNEEESTSLLQKNINDVKDARDKLITWFKGQELLEMHLDSVIGAYGGTLRELETHFDARLQDPAYVLEMTSQIERQQAQIQAAVLEMYTRANIKVEEKISLYTAYLYTSYSLIFIGLILVLLQISNLILRPVKKLHQAIEELKEDRYMSVTTDREDEIGDLIASFNEMSQKLHDSKEELLLTNYQLEQSNKELESFAYSVSHDLRTPLRSISGFSEALMSSSQNNLSDQTRDYLNRVHQAALKMGELIDEILKLSKIGRTMLGREKVDLTALVHELIELTITDENEHVTFEVADGLQLYSDPGLTKVLLLNLLSNAVKFSKNEAEPYIQIGKEVRDKRKYIFIKDNGVGFDMKYDQKIFGAFQRLHSSSEFEGTGIGLATVKKIVNKHNGTIFIESEVGKGTTVYFNLGKNNHG